MIDDRVWNQCQAALAFWREVSRTSRTPPYLHPVVRPFFEDGRPSPLTAEEIESVIASDPVSNRCLGYPLKLMASSTGLVDNRIRRELVRMGAKPTGKIRGAHLWAWRDMRDAANSLLETDRKFRQKYAKSAAKANAPA